MPIISQLKLSLFFSTLLLQPVSMLAQVEFTSSNLPIVFIDTKGQEIQDDERIVA